MEQQIRFDYSTYIGITMQRNWKERILKALSRLALWSVILSCVGFLKTKTRHISRKVLDTSAQYSARFRKCTVYQQPLFSPSHTHVHTTHTAVTSNSLTCATHIQTVTVSAA